jgi:hypothetical protein
MSPRYRTYVTEARARKRMVVLQTKYQEKFFTIMLAPQDFRYVVAVFCEPDRWALCA